MTERVYNLHSCIHACVYELMYLCVDHSRLAEESGGMCGKKNPLRAQKEKYILKRLTMFRPDFDPLNG